jgi:hypothetical protein
MDLPGEQVDARHQGDCSVPLVLVIATDCRMSAGNRRQIGSRRDFDKHPALICVHRQGNDPSCGNHGFPHPMTASYHISNKSRIISTTY